MAMSFSTVAYLGVVVSALALFAIGTPAQRIRKAALNDPAPASTYAVTSAPAVSVVAAAGITLRSVSFDLPTNGRSFPGGDAAEVANNNCTACHSAGMVLTQPNLTKAGWEEEINKMRSIYKAPIDAADVPAIADYLASIKGRT